MKYWVIKNTQKLYPYEIHRSVLTGWGTRKTNDRYEINSCGGPSRLAMHLHDHLIITSGYPFLKKTNLMSIFQTFVPQYTIVEFLSDIRTFTTVAHQEKIILNPGPDPDPKSDRCIIYYKSERRRRSERGAQTRSLARGVQGHAPPEHFVLTYTELHFPEF